MEIKKHIKKLTFKVLKNQKIIYLFNNHLLKILIKFKKNRLKILINHRQNQLKEKNKTKHPLKIT
jgi:hypothetical protein